MTTVHLRRQLCRQLCRQFRWEAVTPLQASYRPAQTPAHTPPNMRTYITTVHTAVHAAVQGSPFSTLLSLVIRPLTKCSGQHEPGRLLGDCSVGWSVESRLRMGSGTGRGALAPGAPKTLITSHDVERVSRETMTETMTNARKNEKRDQAHHPNRASSCPSGIEPGLS